eukprot:scaffold4584_cov98-Amphora_coffeaeformis.AAC.3
MDPKRFSHDTAEVTHTLLQDSTTRVLLIHSQYVPAVEKGDTLMVYTVGADNESSDLVQIATLPAWRGQNLGAIIMGNAMTERLQQAGYDLFCNPDWLEETPFNLNVPKEDEKDEDATEDDRAEDATEDDRAEDATENDRTKDTTEDDRAEDATEDDRTEYATEDDRAEDATEDDRTKDATEDITSPGHETPLASGVSTN